MAKKEKRSCFFQDFGFLMLFSGVFIVVMPDIVFQEMQNFLPVLLAFFGFLFVINLLFMLEVNEYKLDFPEIFEFDKKKSKTKYLSVLCCFGLLFLNQLFMVYYWNLQNDMGMLTFLVAIPILSAILMIINHYYLALFYTTFVFSPMVAYFFYYLGKTIPNIDFILFCDTTFILINFFVFIILPKIKIIRKVKKVTSKAEIVH